MTTMTRKRPPQCNSLTGKQWLRNSISVWSDISKTADEKKLKHPAMFPVALVERLLETFLPIGDHTVLDPFCGSGTTLVAAEKLGKHGFGFEISEEYASLARSRITHNSYGKSIVFNVGCHRIKDEINPDSIDICVTSPPYWNILNQRRTADGKDTRHYGNLPEDLGTTESYIGFLTQLSSLWRDLFWVLKPGAYCCVVVMDLRKKDKFYPFHSHIAKHMEDAGFKYDDLSIWNRQVEYNNLRPLGFPSVFRVNKVHEFIVIAQKPKQNVAPCRSPSPKPSQAPGLTNRRTTGSARAD
jgi:DNA modification methylase